MAAPTIGQKKVARLTAANTSLNCAFDSAVVSGALLVVFVASSTDYAGWTFGDTQGNTYTLEQGDGFGSVWGKVYTAVANASGSNTIQLNLTSGLAAIHAFEVRGWDGTTRTEKEGRLWQSVSSINSPYSPLNFTATTIAEQLFLGVMAWETIVARTWDGGTGWTTEDQYTAGDSIGSSSISKSVTSTGTYDPEWTGGAGAHNTITIALSVPGGNAGLGAAAVPLMGQACL